MTGLILKRELAPRPSNKPITQAQITAGLNSNLLLFPLDELQYRLKAECELAPELLIEDELVEQNDAGDRLDEDEIDELERYDQLVDDFSDLSIETGEGRDDTETSFDNDWVYEKDADSPTKPHIPEIIFYIENEGDSARESLKYTINSGFFDKIQLNPEIKYRTSFTVSDITKRAKSEFQFEVNSEMLLQHIKDRRLLFSYFAEFLILKQGSAIYAPDLVTFILRLTSIMQKDFLLFLEDVNLLQEQKVDRGKISRLIENKYVQIPCKHIIPVSIFFHDMIGRINILITAIEKNQQQSWPPLSSISQSMILKALCPGEPSSPDDVRKTIWPYLQQIFIRKMYPELSDAEKKECAQLGIAGKAGRLSKNSQMQDSQLIELINQIIHQLDLKIEPFTLEKLKIMTNGNK